MSMFVTKEKQTLKSFREGGKRKTGREPRILRNQVTITVGQCTASSAAVARLTQQPGANKLVAVRHH